MRQSRVPCLTHRRRHRLGLWSGEQGAECHPCTAWLTAIRTESRRATARGRCTDPESEHRHHGVAEAPRGDAHCWVRDIVRPAIGTGVGDKDRHRQGHPASGAPGRHLSGHLTAPRVQDALLDFADLSLSTWPAGPAMRSRIFAIGGNLTAYGAAYVVLAEALDLPLITRYRRLAATAGHWITVHTL